MSDLVSILLPALNEEATIGQVIDNLPRNEFSDRGYDIELLVVDGHSRDRTCQIAADKGARLIKQKGRGKGWALRTAFQDFNGNYLFMLDADNTYPPTHLLSMLDLLEQGDTDVVLGSRMTGNIAPGAMSPLNHFGNRLISGTANLFFPNGHKTTDVCTGMWGFKARVPRELDLSSEQFEVEAEMFAKCVKNGYHIKEIPIDYLKRGGQSKLASVGHGFRILKKLFLEKVRQ